MALDLVPDYAKASIVVHLTTMYVPEDEAVIAAMNCEDAASAEKYLKQECELCVKEMNVKQVRLLRISNCKLT